MSRIDVVRGQKKGTFAVLVNFGMDGRHRYSSPTQANKEAKTLHDSKYPHAELHLIVIQNVKES